MYQQTIWGLGKEVQKSLNLESLFSKIKKKLQKLHMLQSSSTYCQSPTINSDTV